MAGSNPLTTTEEQYFRSQGRNLRQNYLFGVAQNTLQRKQAGFQYNVAKRDVMRQYRDQRRGYSGDYVQRGRLGGGAYQRGLSELQQARTRALGQLGTAYDFQNSQFAQNSSQLAQAYYQNAGNLTEQRRALLQQLQAQDLLNKRLT